MSTALRTQRHAGSSPAGEAKFHGAFNSRLTSFVVVGSPATGPRAPSPSRAGRAARRRTLTPFEPGSTPGRAANLTQGVRHCSAKAVFYVGKTVFSKSGSGLHASRPWLERTGTGLLNRHLMQVRILPGAPLRYRSTVVAMDMPALWRLQVRRVSPSRSRPARRRRAGGAHCLQIERRTATSTRAAVGRGHVRRCE